MIEFVGATYLEIVSLGGGLAAAHFLFHFFHGCLLGVIGDAGILRNAMIFSIKGPKEVDFATKGGKIGWFLIKPRGIINCQVNRDCIIQKK